MTRHAATPAFRPLRSISYPPAFIYSYKSRCWTYCLALLWGLWLHYCSNEALFCRADALLRWTNAPVLCFPNINSYSVGCWLNATCYRLLKVSVLSMAECEQMHHWRTWPCVMGTVGAPQSICLSVQMIGEDHQSATCMIGLPVADTRKFLSQNSPPARLQVLPQSWVCSTAGIRARRPRRHIPPRSVFALVQRDLRGLQFGSAHQPNRLVSCALHPIFGGRLSSSYNAHPLVDSSSAVPVPLLFNNHFPIANVLSLSRLEVTLASKKTWWAETEKERKLVGDSYRVNASFHSKPLCFYHHTHVATINACITVKDIAPNITDRCVHVIDFTFTFTVKRSINKEKMRHKNEFLIYFAAFSLIDLWKSTRFQSQIWTDLTWPDLLKSLKNQFNILVSRRTQKNISWLFFF